jgi:hypothetical protein
MSWAFIHATSDFKFVASDNPLYYINPKYKPSFYGDDGLLNKNIEVTFPLSSEIALLASWKNDMKGYFKINNGAVKTINHRTIMATSKYVFANLKSERINRVVQKYIGSAPIIKVS